MSNLQPRFRVTLEPTPEFFEVRTQDGRKLRTRVWTGRTACQTPIEAYIYSIAPPGGENLALELPEFMTKTSNLGAEAIDPTAYPTLNHEIRSYCLHLFGREPTEDEERLVSYVLNQL